VIDQQATTQPYVYIVVLNWNGWQDTIECLESVFRLDYPSFTVVVCDNASNDGSIKKIKDWAHGKITAACSSPDLSRLTMPAYPKPIALVSIAGSEATTTKPPPDVRLVLIETGANLGFAGGNNVGIRYALAHGHLDYVWLLNNDTVIEPDSLSALVLMAQDDPMLGICGSLLLRYHAPHDILTAGGRAYSRWNARSRPLQEFATPQTSTKPGGLDYVEGASMLISRSLLEEVGLLEERYFLYFEEVDLATRARPKFHLGYASNSLVYHKEGASTGSANIRANRSAFSDFYQVRSRLLFTKRFHPWFLPFVLAAVAVSAFQRILIRRPGNATAMLSGALASFSRKRSNGWISHKADRTI
jgi:GT2 family glycosyltransferase